MKTRKVNEEDPLYREIDDLFQNSGMSREDTAKAMMQHVVGMAKAQGESDENIAKAIMMLQNGFDERRQEYAQHSLLRRKQYHAKTIKKDIEERKLVITFWKNFRRYYEMIFCSEIQRYALHVLEKLKLKGLYRHEMKKCANLLNQEAKVLQYIYKDCDRLVTTEWCQGVKIKNDWAIKFYEDGASIGARFVSAFREKFKHKLHLIQLDCKALAEACGAKHPDLVADLYMLVALTDTGIELEDVCTKHIRKQETAHLRVDIVRLGRNEKMKNAAALVIERLMPANIELPQTEAMRARQNLYNLQVELAEEGAGDFFQTQFDAMKKEFILYTLALMRVEMEEGGLTRDSMRILFARMTKKDEVRKVIRQLKSVRLPDMEDSDLLDVAEAIENHNFKTPMLDKYRKMCFDGAYYDPTKEDMEKEENRILRGVARQNEGQLPDDVLRVMVYHHKTKKSMLDKIAAAGPELKPTLRRLRRMTRKQLEQL